MWPLSFCLSDSLASKVQKSKIHSGAAAYQQHLMPEHIGYGVKGEGPVFRLLQSVVDLRHSAPRLYPYNPNVLFALGQESEQVVVRCRPNVGYGQWTHAGLTSYVRQRMASHRQVVRGTSAWEFEALVTADAAVAAELLRLNYSVESLRRIWCGIPPERQDRAAVAVREALKSVKKRAPEDPIHDFWRHFGINPCE